MLPLGVLQVLVAGGEDEVVPPSLNDAYAAAAGAAGDELQVINIEDAGHIDLIDPQSEGWKQIKAALLAALK